MSEMTPENAAALRKPFPKSAIGKLPKGGMQLDYVGHAAVTDRLLAIDPEWSWEPLATTEAGLPCLDNAGNLWIRLTVCGHTRIGVGDGKNAKECISDALRNAAMRFGVALDLWSKEELEGGHGEAVRADPASKPQQWSDEPPSHAVPGDPMSTKTRGHLFALFGQKGVPEDQQLPGVNHINGTAHTSRSQITEAEANAVIAVLKQRPDAAPVAPFEDAELPPGGEHW